MRTKHVEKKSVSESSVLILIIPLTYFVYLNVIFYYLMYIVVLILINGLLLSLCDRLILAPTPLLVLFSVPGFGFQKRTPMRTTRSVTE